MFRGKHLQSVLWFFPLLVCVGLEHYLWCLTNLSVFLFCRLELTFVCCFCFRSVWNSCFEFMWMSFFFFFFNKKKKKKKIANKENYLQKIINFDQDSLKETTFVKYTLHLSGNRTKLQHRKSLSPFCLDKEPCLEKKPLMQNVFDCLPLSLFPVADLIRFCQCCSTTVSK